ncbi:MAG: DNA mismatch endonuclease Vsr [Anaerolineales bacterium]|nr:DNA mismatch endonuclease Vsr [Anaerolineales bacterium]
MADTFSKEKRSEIMAAIHSKNTHSTERRLRAGLVSARISGWRMNAKDLAGRPDFVFDKKKIVIFVDGCFWHGCKCKRLSKTHKSFWKNKIETNISRDKRASRILRKQGWKVVRIKEHELKASVSKTMGKVKRIIGV